MTYQSTKQPQDRQTHSRPFHHRTRSVGRRNDDINDDNNDRNDDNNDDIRSRNNDISDDNNDAINGPSYQICKKQKRCY